MIRKIQIGINDFRARIAPVKSRLKNRHGFDLLQLIMYIAIAAILILGSIAAYSKVMSYARETTCESDIKTTGDAVMRYYAEVGHIPDVTSFEELKDELTREDLEIDGRTYGPWMKENMNVNDPWGNPFEFKYESGSKFDICSQGNPEDGKEICYNSLGRSKKES